MQALRQRTLYGSCPRRYAWGPSAAAASTRGRKQAVKILDSEPAITSPGTEGINVRISMLEEARSVPVRLRVMSP